MGLMEWLEPFLEGGSNWWKGIRLKYSTVDKWPKILEGVTPAVVLLILAEQDRGKVELYDGIAKELREPKKTESVPTKGEGAQGATAASGKVRAFLKIPPSPTLSPEEEEAEGTRLAKNSLGPSVAPLVQPEAVTDLSQITKGEIKQFLDGIVQGGGEKDNLFIALKSVAGYLDALSEKQVMEYLSSLNKVTQKGKTTDQFRKIVPQIIAQMNNPEKTKTYFSELTPESVDLVLRHIAQDVATEKLVEVICKSTAPDQAAKFIDSEIEKELRGAGFGKVAEILNCLGTSHADIKGKVQGLEEYNVHKEMSAERQAEVVAARQEAYLKYLDWRNEKIAKHNEEFKKAQSAGGESS